MKRKTASLRKAHPYLMCDTAAVACGIALFLYFILTAGIGIGLPDELYHFILPFRIMHGDSFLVHDWSIEQISQLMNIIPYWLFVKITGSTDGLVLFSRFFFISVDILFYCYMYGKLRRKLGFWAVLSTFLFCAVLPPAGLSLYYYNISAMAMMQICLMLFLDTEKKNGLRLIIAGFVWGIAILAEPMVFLMCVLFILAVAARLLSRKRLFSAYSFILSQRDLGWLALGAFIVQLLFILVIRLTGGMDIVMETIPYFLGGSGYSGASLFDFWKIPELISCYGVPGLLLWLFSFVGAIYYRFLRRKDHREQIKKRKANLQKKNDRFRLIVFSVSCFAFSLCNIWALRCAVALSYSLLRKMILYQGVPLLLFSPIWYLLCENRRPDVEWILLFGTGYSFFSDISSDVMLGLGGSVTMLAGFISLRTLFAELKPHVISETLQRKNIIRTSAVPRIAVVSVLALCISFVTVKSVYIFGERLFPTEERGMLFERRSEAIDTDIPAGPYKGLRTTRFIAEIIEATERDLDVITEKDPASVMFAGVCPFAYFYMDRPVGCSTAFYQRKNYEEQQDYWAMFPEKLPAFIYIPDYDYYTYSNKKDSEKRIDISLIVPDGVSYDVTELEVGRLISLRPSQNH